MRCHICDKALSEKEISWNKDIGTFEPCSECLEISLDAAFSDGFSRPDEDDSFVIVEDEDDQYSRAFSVMLSVFKRDKGEDE